MVINGKEQTPYDEVEVVKLLGSEDQEKKEKEQERQPRLNALHNALVLL